MSTTTKSPRRVLVFAYLIGRMSLREYAHKYSPKKFTQPQLFACLVFKEFLRLDYRKLAGLLRDCSDLTAAIDLETVPHFTTFQKAADRLLLSGEVRKLLDATLDVALDQALARKPITTLVADAGYDAEHVHEYAREECGVNTFIPPLIGRPTKKKPSGFWRRRMASRLHLTRYGQRWQIETVNSMLKRLLGSSLRARRYHSQCRELSLRAITLNVMILKRLRVFYGARVSPFFFIASGGS